MKHFCIAIPDDNPETYRLIASLKRNGITTQVINKGPMPITPMGMIALQHEFVMRQDDDDVLMYTDAYDVLILQNEEKILEAFYEFDVPVVFAAEKCCWPDDKKMKLYPPSLSPWRYLNAGCYIGYVGALKKVISMAHRRCHPIFKRQQSSQRVYTDVYLKNRDVVTLDTECRIFQTLFLSENDMVFKDGEWGNTVTDTKPCAVHANSQRHNIEPIANALGYR